MYREPGDVLVINIDSIAEFSYFGNILRGWPIQHFFNIPRVKAASIFINDMSKKLDLIREERALLKVENYVGGVECIQYLLDMS